MFSKKIIVMRLDGHELLFEIEGEMVNVTRMGRPYGPEKRPDVWLRTPEAAEIQKMVAIIKGCNTKSLIRIDGEGDNAKVWFDMGLAIPYAGWLLPAFQRWCAVQVLRMKEQIACEHDVGNPRDDDDDRGAVMVGIHRLGDLPS